MIAHVRELGTDAVGMHVMCICRLRQLLDLHQDFGLNLFLLCNALY